MKKRIILIMRMIIGTGSCVGFCYLAQLLKLPLLGNQFAVLAAAIFWGPAYAIVMALFSGIISMLLGISGYIFILPAMAGAVACSVYGKSCRILEKLRYTVTAICIVSFAEGIVLAIAMGISHDGTTLLYFTDNLMSMLTLLEFPAPFIYLTTGLFTVYADVTLDFLLLWHIHYIENPLKKKHERRKYLKRNLAAAAAVTIAVLSVMTAVSVPVSAKTNGDTSYVERIYDSDDGIAGGTANDIVQTSDGQIWVATYEGLYTFDGKKFEMITDIPNVRSTMCLFVGSDGSLWIGNNGTGLVVKKTDGTILFLDSYTGLPSDSIRSIAQFNESTYYVATGKGLAVINYDGDELSLVKVLNENQYINSVEISENGTVAFFSSDNIIYFEKNGEIFQTLSVTSGDISSIDFDDDDDLYVGKSTSQIDVYSDVNGQYFPSNSIDMENMLSVYRLCFSDGIIYFAAQNGLGYIDKDERMVSVYAEGFSSNVRNIMIDYQGNVWFTSDRNGLLCLEKSVFSDVFSACKTTDHVTNSVTEWNGLMYAGTDSGLLALDMENGENVKNDVTKYFADDARIRCTYVDSDNSLWVSNYYGGTVEVTEDGKFYSYGSAEGLDIGDKARFCKELSDGTVLISHVGGMAFVKDHKMVSQYVCGESMCSAYALSAEEMSPGVILVGTDGEGIQVYENGKLLRTITRKDGISCGIILRMLKDPYSDGVFVLTGSGLCYLHSDFTAEELKDFPYYNNIDMWINDEGTAFVLSTAGIFACSYDSIMSDSPNTTLLDKTAGLASSITSNGWNYMTDDGILYISGNKGVYSLDTHNYKSGVSDYRPSISSVSFDTGETKSPVDNRIEIPAGVKSVTFSLGICNYTSQDPYVRYYMAGVDETKTIVKGSQLSEVTYSNPSSGEYEFYIEVLDDDKETPVLKTVYNIIKEKEPYEKTGFLVWVSLNIAWITASVIITIINFSIRISTRRQKTVYERTLTRLESEKAQALEEALRHEERANKSKSDFLASMSHEIRTPINAIIGMDTMILRETNQQSVKGYAVNVKSASETLLALINDILDFSKIESGKMELVPDEYDVGSLINDLVNMIRPKAEAKKLEFNFSIDPNIPVYLYGDSVRIKQIILNILNNSVKYTERGSVTMELRSEQADETQIALSVKISDTGIGIKQEDIKKLFSPYERIEEKRNKNVEGTGLGMSITKNLLALMNSSLSVESVYGEGSTFSFTILQPVRSDEVIGNFEDRLKSLSEETVDEETFHCPDAKLLIVDDVEMNLIVAESLLKRIEAQITTASSGKEALKLCSQNRYDIIFLDSMMPELSGEETLKILKAECDINKDTPVIVLTANALKSAKDEYLSAGFDDYLSKPIDSFKFESMIKAYLPKELIITDFERKEPGENMSESSGASDGAAAAGNLSDDDILIEKIGRISGIDVSKGVETAGGKEVYLNVLHNFYDTAESRVEMIENYFRAMDIQNYTIQVHALKSSARIIGAFALSEEALAMEMAGRENNKDLIDEKTDHLVSEYRRLYMELDEVYMDSGKEDTRPEMTAKKLRRNLSDLEELIEAYDFETAKELLSSFEDYKLPEDFKSYYKEIKGKLAEIDHDGILNALENYRNQ